MIDQRTAPYAALILRLASGLFLMTHGYIKLFYLALPETAQLFSANGLSAWAGYFIPAMELVGGFAILIGYYTRYFALFFIAEFAASIYLVYWGNGWLFTAKGGGWEFPAFWILVLFAQMLLGDGAFAINKTRQRNMFT